MVANVCIMSQPDVMVSLQFKTPRRIRARLRSAAALELLEISETASILLDWALGLMEKGKAPPDLTAAFEKARKARDKD